MSWEKYSSRKEKEQQCMLKMLAEMNGDMISSPDELKGKTFRLLAFIQHTTANNLLCHDVKMWL